MGSSSNASKENNKENKSAKQNPIIENIKSRYILSKIYGIMTQKKKLEIVRWNKKIQNRLNLDIKDYKEYSQTFSSIEIEIIPRKDKYGKFINIDNKDELYYHIYFNDNKKEIKYKYDIEEKDKVIKIKNEYEKLYEKLIKEIEDFNIKKNNFEKYKEEEINKMTISTMIDIFKKSENIFQIIIRNNDSYVDLYEQSWNHLDLSRFSFNYRCKVHKLSYNNHIIKINKLSENGNFRRSYKMTRYSHSYLTCQSPFSMLLDVSFEDGTVSSDIDENQIKQRLKYLNYINIRKRK
jgi:hypothetical protein